MNVPLSDAYQHIAAMYSLTGLPAKLCLLSVVGIVAAGNRRPGQTLLTVALAGLLLVPFYVIFQGQQDVRADGLLPVTVVSLVVAIALIIAALKPEGEWSAKPKSKARLIIGWSLILLAMYYPFHGTGWLRSILFSPVGALPHSGLLAGAGVIWMSAPNASRLAGWAIAAGCVALGAIDLVAGVSSSSVLILGGGMAAYAMWRGLADSGAGLLEDDTPPVDRQRREEVTKTTEKSKPGKVWKLK